MKPNGISRFIKLGLAVVVVLAFVFYGFHIIMEFISLGKYSEAVSIVMLYLSTLGFVLKDFLSSSQQDEIHLKTSQSCKQHIQMNIDCE